MHNRVLHLHTPQMDCHTWLQCSWSVDVGTTASTGAPGGPRSTAPPGCSNRSGPPSTMATAGTSGVRASHVGLDGAVWGSSCSKASCTTVKTVSRSARAASIAFSAACALAVSSRARRCTADVTSPGAAPAAAGVTYARTPKQLIQSTNHSRCSITFWCGLFV